MHILIIGGTGVLSSAVTNEALLKGISVTMINRGNRIIPNGVEHIKADKNDYQTIAKSLDGRMFDAVMDYLCFSDRETIESFNFYSQFTGQYFFISSCAVYDTIKSGVCKEDSPKVLSVWPYSIKKWNSEKKLMSLAKSSNTKVTIIRPSVTYGDTRIPYGIAPVYGYHWTIVARIMAGKPIIRWNEGRNRCNMTRVEDFAVGVVGLIGNPKAYGEAFNVCGDDAPSFNDVLDTISQYLNKDIVTVDISSTFYAKELPTRAGEILGGRSIDAINSNQKLKDAVPEFTQTINLQEGVFRTLDAYKNNHYQLGIDWEYEGDCDRIIRKWCKMNGIDDSNMHLGFTDYFGNASFYDKLLYLKSFYFNKQYYQIRKVLGTLKRILFS